MHIAAPNIPVCTSGSLYTCLLIASHNIPVCSGVLSALSNVVRSGLFLIQSSAVVGFSSADFGVPEEQEMKLKCLQSEVCNYLFSWYCQRIQILIILNKSSALNH